jgi:XTP/dITP diphosphohydrolase
MCQPTVVLGTHNRQKAAELRDLLEPRGCRVHTLADFPSPLCVVEDGQTFAENATRKACQQAVHLQAWVLGEDSGLEVDALHGRPGIHSARFAGDAATDAANIHRLLDHMRHVSAGHRSARYVCHVTLADPTGTVRADVEAYCCGRIAASPRGHAGFGYDPVFEVAEYHRTFGELGASVKSVLSHRGRALRRLVHDLLPLLQSTRADR